MLGGGDGRDGVLYYIWGMSQCCDGKPGWLVLKLGVRPRGHTSRAQP